MKHNRKIISSLMLAFCFILLMIVLLDTYYVPLRYRLIVGSIALILIMLVLIFTKKVVFRALLSLLLILSSVFIYNSQAMFKDVSSSKSYEKIRYNFLAEKIKASYGKVGYYNVNFLQEEELFTDITARYQVDEFIPYNNIFTLAQAVVDGQLDGIIINSNLLSEIVFVDEDFLDTVFVMDHFTLEVPYEMEHKPVDVNKEPFIVYASGIDVYGDVALRSRSDMNLLLVVNPLDKKILVISIPRDTYVPLACADNAMDKLTHAGLYGISCLVRTLENFFEIDINYYFRVNFTGLEELVDYLGGVDVYSAHEFSTDAGLHFSEGLNFVNGNEALAFARERINVPEGDIDRGLNHQALLRAIFEKATRLDELPKLPITIQILQDLISTNFGDANFSKIMRMQMEYSQEWQFETDYLKGKGDMQTVYSLDERYKYYVYWPDQSSIAEIQQAIQEMLQVRSE